MTLFSRNGIKWNAAFQIRTSIREIAMFRFYRLALLLTVSVIFAIGLAMIFNTSSAEVLDHSLTKSTHQALVKQIFYALGGLLLAYSISKIGYQKLMDWSPYLLALFCILLILVLIPGIGREVNGSKRWLSIAGFSFQPSEFVKYLIPVYLTKYILAFGGPKMDFKNFCKMIGIVSIPMLLILVEPNNGTAGVIFVTIIIMCVITQIRFKYWAFPLFTLMLIGGVSAYNLPYVTARLNVYLHPELDIKGKGHQPYQAKIAAGSGQLIGRGPGNSLQKLSYLPEAQNDYIAAIFAEEFGFVGILVLIILYMFIAYIGFSIAHFAKNRGGFYMATALTFLISFQAFMNLGVVSGLLPSTGLNLPFFSQGGSSLMANVIAISLLLSIIEKKRSPSYAI